MRNGWTEMFVFLFLALLLTPLLGEYCASVLGGRQVALLRFMRPFETWLYRATKADRTGDAHSGEMDWREYSFCVLSFSAVAVLFVEFLQCVQIFFELNTQYGLAARDLAIAAAGMAVVAAIARGINRKQFIALGNFWGDIVRSTLYILLPISLIASLLLVGQGVVPNNFLHAFANSSFIKILAILIIPSALTYAFGVLVGKRRQGIAILSVMTVVLMTCLLISL